MKQSVRVPALTILLLAGFSGCSRGNPDALWQIVHEQCVPNERQHGNPAPCIFVNLPADGSSGTAVLKDRHGPYQYLLIPTERIIGIEDGALYVKGSDHYFSDAWAARRYVEQGVGHPIPRDALSLAINSRYARSQNQLHIHVDCLRAEVRTVLHDEMLRIGEDWAPLPKYLAGHRFNARRLHDADLSHEDPFLLLPTSVKDDREERSRHTLVVVGAHFADSDDGFVLLDGRAAIWPFDTGHGEDLQDHSCQ